MRAARRTPGTEFGELPTANNGTRPAIAVRSLRGAEMSNTKRKKQTPVKRPLVELTPGQLSAVHGGLAQVGTANTSTGSDH
jgi:hypothetical protein